ncbi:uncharacterized protein VTP21DRAFT_349 [Calcarisporiella thermophila]|uniref:uncharacterized protein n=1 Tax=Calcarisporiella thermophila TaxID=911321 RepID=UPI003743096A
MVNQTDAPWGLVRISHRKRTDTRGGYVYDPKAGAGTASYVIDTGIDLKHPEFEGRASWGATFANDGDSDLHGHGTHVAGIVGGKTYGVAKKTKLIAVKVLDKNGSASISNVVAGINWAANHAKQNNRGLSVAVLPLGGGASNALNDAVNRAVESGLPIAVGAGGSNDDGCKYSPCSAAKAICIGATDINDKRAPFSNHGKCVSLFAPGVSVISAWPGNKSNTLSGTSPAAAHGAGLIAYFLALKQRDPASMLAYMKQIATKISGGDLVYNDSGL